MHLLDAVLSEGAGRLSGSWSLVAYRGSQLPHQSTPFKGGLRPLQLEVPGSMEELREALEDALEIPELEEFQTPWALFDRQGSLIVTLEALRAAEVAFLQQIGVWVWPPVRVGFQQEAIGVGGGNAVLTTLSLRPKIFEVREFLSDNETQAIMDLGKKQGLVSSKGVMQSHDIDKGTADAEFRTSKQAWLHTGSSPLVGELDQRVAELTRVPVDHQEATQLLRYESGEYYHNHMDWAELEYYPDQKQLWIEAHMGWQDRLATVFWYLNDVPEGGQTNFPKHGQPICGPLERGGPNWRFCPGAFDPPHHKCDVGFKVKPQRGTVVMWYNYHANGRGDTNALHAGCPVGEGLVKWSANKWVRIKPLEARGSERPRWIEDHPAVERFAWKGEDAKKQFDPDACEITFVNSAHEAAEIMWVGGSGGVSLGDLDAGESRSMNSFIEHQFYMQVGERTSNIVLCVGPVMRVRLGADLQLRKIRDDGAQEEL